MLPAAGPAGAITLLYRDTPHTQSGGSPQTTHAYAGPETNAGPGRLMACPNARTQDKQPCRESRQTTHAYAGLEATT